VLSNREAEAMASAEQQAIVNLEPFSKSIGFSATREVIDRLPLENPPVLSIDHNRLNNNPLLTANSRGSTGAMGFWFWGSIGLDERVVIREV
jgi:hypothetical protein